ncbi:MAG: PH domain-containing protein [Litorimonas sp.]
MKTHKSKIDNWFRVVVLIIALTPFMFLLIENIVFWPMLAICGLCVAFMVWLYVATKYVISEDVLTIHAGLYKVITPISEITSITDTNNALASPAFSLDRLEIKYGEGEMILISPIDKSAFLADLGRKDS